MKNLNENVQKTYLCADPYGCPIHHHGHSSKERRCSCKTFWTDDPSNKVNIICDSTLSKEDRDVKIEQYENQ